MANIDLEKFKEEIKKEKELLKEMKEKVSIGKGDLEALRKDIAQKEADIAKLKDELRSEKEDIQRIEEKLNLNIAGKLAKTFLKNPLTPVIAILLFLLGVIAVMFTPREENPQIDVPAISVTVPYPGVSSKEIEQTVVKPLSRKLSEMLGVDHIYSMASNSVGMVIVQFKIGSDKQKALVELYDRVMQNIDMLPKDARDPIIKPIDIDEVPIVTIALASDKYNDHQLYQMAHKFLTPLSRVENVSVVGIKGGHKTQFNVIVDPIKVAAYHLSLGQVIDAIAKGNYDYPLGKMQQNKFSIPVEYDGFIKTAKDVGNIMVAVYNNRPIYVKDIAQVKIGYDYQHKHQTTFQAAAGSHLKDNFNHKIVNQVTIYVGKKRGTNAVFVAEGVLEEVKELQKELPKDVKVIITRNDGEKANEAVNELIFHLIISIAIIVVLLIVMLGFRESMIVAFTVPLILAVTLFGVLMTGQTINRITLFALILSLGLLVDSAIVVIENIHRHLSIGGKPIEKIVVEATNEVGNPTNIATLAIILAFLPMLAVGGMMGPFMAPIPQNVPVAMIASLVVAYIFTPWAVLKFLPHDEHADHGGFDIKKTKTYEIFYKILNPMLESKVKRAVFIFGLIALMFGAFLLPVFKIVIFKMLPGANKNTFKVTVKLPKGSAIDKTREVVTCIQNKLEKEKEIKDTEGFIGTGAVVDFSGLLKGSFLKRGENVAEIRVNLVHGHKESSIYMVSRLRPELQQCGVKYNANIKLEEVPPGPPTIATLLMEVTGGKNEAIREDLATKIESLFKQTKGVVDVDMIADEDIIKYKIIPDKEKAALAGITAEQMAKILGAGVRGAVITNVHYPDIQENTGLFIRYDKKYRDSLNAIKNIKVMSPTYHRLVPLSELVKIIPVADDKMLVDKDQRHTIMVTGEMNIRGSLYALLDIFNYLKEHGLPGYKIIYDGNPRLNLVAIDEKTGDKFDLIWDGEWKITFDVFRDLGGAFMVGVVLIYFLMVAYYKDFRIPRIVLAATPLTFIGVLPGHAIMDLFTPTYFTATSMVGFIALSGIVVRNSLLLIDYTNELINQGRDINTAVIEAAATRFRPILLTALGIILASTVIVLDPVWQGLAVALIFGVFVSTMLSLVAVPLLYWRYLRDKQAKGLL